MFGLVGPRNGFIPYEARSPDKPQTPSGAFKFPNLARSGEGIRQRVNYGSFVLGQNRKFQPGGMIPKVSSCIQALSGGVKKTHIVDARIPHALLLEIFTDRGIGTQILKE